MLEHDDIGAGTWLEPLEFFDGDDGIVCSGQDAQGQGNLAGKFRLNAVSLEIFTGTGVVCVFFQEPGCHFPQGFHLQYIAKIHNGPDIGLVSR